MSKAFRIAVTIIDALSQLLGRCIPVYYGGRWRHYTRSANESISGASDWHAECGRWPWVKRALDFVFSPMERDHCFKSRLKDLERAKQLIESEGFL